MGNSRKLFKALASSIKAFKSPSKEKSEKDKSASKGDKYHVTKTNKEKCLWSVGKSSSRNRNSIAAAAACLDAPNMKSLQLENEDVKDAPHTDLLFTSTAACGPNVEAASFTGGDRCLELVEQEELAAIKIQAAYRRHLASQQVIRALRAVVRLQALARGQMVRKQASAALQCIQALVKLQALARGRRIRSSELGRLIQEHLQQTRHLRKKTVEDWVSSISSLQPSQAKAQSKQDAIMKRQRALVYTLSEQLNRSTPKPYSLLANDFRPDKSHWGWVWLERWMAARPWENFPGGEEELNKEEMVKVKTDVEVNEEGYEKYTPPVEDPEGNPNIESISSVDFESNSLSNSEFTMEKESMPSVESMKEEHMYIPAHVEDEKAGETSATKISASNNDSGTGQAALTSAPPRPPPPPPLPPLYAMRANSVAHRASFHEDLQAAILANKHSEMPLAFQVPHLNLPARAAEPLVETCSTTLVTHFRSPCASELASPDLPSSPVKDSMPLATAYQPIEAFTAQVTLQSHPESPLPHNQSVTTSPLMPEPHKVLLELDMANISMSKPSASDSSPISPSQHTSSPTASSEVVLVLPPQKHAVTCSPLFIPDVTYIDGISNQDNASEENGIISDGDRCTSLAVQQIHGFDEGDVTMDPAENGSMVLKNDPIDMDTEVPDSINFKSEEVIRADPFSGANGACDAFVAPGGEKSTDGFSSKHASPVCKQGQSSEAGLPSVPNYMTTTKSSKAKIRPLTSPTSKSDSLKQKADSPKPRFDSSSKQKMNSPKQKVDSLKQKLESPKQKGDSSTKRRHSLSALEGKGSLGALKSSLVRASSKGQVGSLKETCAENSPCSNGVSRKPVAV